MPLLFTTFWGDQPAGMVAITCLHILIRWNSECTYYAQSSFRYSRLLVVPLKDSVVASSHANKKSREPSSIHPLQSSRSIWVSKQKTSKPSHPHLVGLPGWECRGMSWAHSTLGWKHCFKSQFKNHTVQRQFFGCPFFGMGNTCGARAKGLQWPPTGSTLRDQVKSLWPNTIQLPHIIHRINAWNSYLLWA